MSCCCKSSTDKHVSRSPCNSRAPCYVMSQHSLLVEILKSQIRLRLTVVRVYKLYLLTYCWGDGGGGGIDSPDEVASSLIVGALASVISPTPHKIQNDDRLPQHISGVSGWMSLLVLAHPGVYLFCLSTDMRSIRNSRTSCLVVVVVVGSTYPSLETLTEPHRLVACLHCTVSVARSMLAGGRWYPEGRLHIIPLMTFSLPGIDPNDIKKSLVSWTVSHSLTFNSLFLIYFWNKLGSFYFISFFYNYSQ